MAKEVPPPPAWEGVSLYSDITSLPKGFKKSRLFSNKKTGTCFKFKKGTAANTDLYAYANPVSKKVEYIWSNYAIGKGFGFKYHVEPLALLKALKESFGKPNNEGNCGQKYQNAFGATASDNLSYYFWQNENCFVLYIYGLKFFDFRTGKVPWQLVHVCSTSNFGKNICQSMLSGNGIPITIEGIRDIKENIGAYKPKQ